MKSRVRAVICLALVVLLYGWSPNRLPLTDPDEVFYSQTAKEMAQQHSLVTPLIFGHPQYEKPPLFYWLLMAAFKMEGVTRVAARSVPALCGLLGIVATFLFCRRLFNREVAWIAAILLATSAIYLAMSMAVLTDVALSMFMMVAFYAFFLWTRERRDIDLHVFGVAAAFAVLTKGPVAIVILVVTAVLYLAILGEAGLLRRFLLHPWVLSFAALGVPWYAVILARDGRAFFGEFIVHDNLDRILHAEHQNFDHWWFYPVTAVAGLFPWTFELTLMGRAWRKHVAEHVFFFLWFAVTFTVFEIARSKLASYILPLVPALVIPLAIALDDMKRRAITRSWANGAQLLSGLALAAAPSLLARRFPSLMVPATAHGMRIMGVALIAGSLLIRSGRIRGAILAKACGVAVVVLVVGSGLPPALDRAFADAFVAGVVSREHYRGEAIVTDRRYARGVYFYTGSPIVIMDHNKQPFWSPHPLEVISSDAEIEQYFGGRDRVLCVVEEEGAEEIEHLFEGTRVSRRIANDGHKVVLMSEKVQRLAGPTRT
jgi:4-amino-4-deoxy-L-arabinose transferase-like glycosyltransferase